MAARTNEAHELRLQNRALYEENARLNDLARMLLGSPHFANFLNDMPDNNVPPTQGHQPQQLSRPPAPQPNMQAPLPSDANVNRPQMQHNPQVSMVMVPNQGMEASMLNNGGWNSGIDMNFGNTPVFAVLDVPEGPVFDMEALSGKSFSPIAVSEGPKGEMPALNFPASHASTSGSDIGVANPDVEIDESDPAFALFSDSPVPATVGQDLVFEGVPAKQNSPFELVVDSAEVSIAAKNRFNFLCSSIEAAFQRVSSFTSHLQ